MPTRELLPQRRRSETFNLDWGNMVRAYTVTVSYYNDGRIGEIFIVGGKSGEQIEAIARDGAVSVSIALQYGANIHTLAKAITRDSQGQPQTIIGAVLDHLVKMELDHAA